jgi:hypothetical protein
MGRKAREDDSTKEFKKAVKAMGKPSKKEDKKVEKSLSSCPTMMKSSRNHAWRGPFFRCVERARTCVPTGRIGVMPLAVQRVGVYQCHGSLCVLGCPCVMRSKYSSLGYASQPAARHLGRLCPMAPVRPRGSARLFECRPSRRASRAQRRGYGLPRPSGEPRGSAVRAPLPRDQSVAKHQCPCKCDPARGFLR